MFLRMNGFELFISGKFVLAIATAIATLVKVLS